MIGVLLSTLIYLIPLAAIVFFIASLCFYISARKRYKAEHNDVNAREKNSTKTFLIVSSIIMGVLLAVIIGFIAMMYTAIAYM